MKIEELAQLHKALAVPVRLRILGLIGERSLCVNAITRCLEISQPAVSQHLAVLKRAGLVSSTKRGYTVHYKLDPERLQLSWISASEGQRYADVVNHFTEKIKKLGPNSLNNNAYY